MRTAVKARSSWQFLAAGLALAAASGGAVARTASERVVYSFQGGAKGDGLSPTTLSSAGGTLFGTTYEGGTATGRGEQGHGTVYSLTPDGKESVLYRFAGATDGIHPTAAPLDVDGTLYGTTASGGLYDEGAAYRLLPDGTEQIIYSFGALPDTADGAEPYGALIQVNGLL